MQMNSVHDNPGQNQSVQRPRLSRGDFHRMRTVGILSEHDRGELIEGELFDRTPIGTKHAFASLSYDRNVKLKLYAAHGVLEVWLIDVNKGRVEVYRTPSAEGYRDLHHLLPEESVSPVRIPELTVCGVDLVSCNG